MAKNLPVERFLNRLKHGRRYTVTCIFSTAANNGGYHYIQWTAPINCVRGGRNSIGLYYAGGGDCAALIVSPLLADNQTRKHEMTLYNGAKQFTIRLDSGIFDENGFFRVSKPEYELSLQCDPSPSDGCCAVS